MKQPLPYWFLCLPLALLSWSCSEKKATPSRKALNEMNLKAGKVIICGLPDAQFGTVRFPIACPGPAQESFGLGLKLLHSFEYEEAEKVFAGIIRTQPTCAMAYWGVAMSNFHPLWAPPTEAELQKGAKAVAIARALPQLPAREADYLATIAAFYQDWPTVDHRTRCLRFEQATEQLAQKYPDDKEATVFYALALTAAAAPTDTTFTKQKKAGRILAALYPDNLNHPGIVHYLIHAYDTPTLAVRALPAARRYAAVAPSSAHAQHMPSHIFTRLGLWTENIESNLASVAAAQCYAQQAGIKGHWDEELHGLDYLMYAYLQKGENRLARQQWDYLQTIQQVEPLTFKVAYSFAAIPARYLLENRNWPEAATLQSHATDFPWEKFPWQKAIIHFARLMGAAHTHNRPAAQAEVQELRRLQALLLQQKDAYKATQVEIQLTSGLAWLDMQDGKPEQALRRMRAAADLEDRTEKPPVTPGEVLPARELLGDMLLQLHRPNEALAAYEEDLRRHPNRFNGLYGAGLAAGQIGNEAKANRYYQQLLTQASGSTRPELSAARRFLAVHSQPTAASDSPVRYTSYAAHPASR
ncbi:tetratricopeptide repeat protein [Hymenobacter lucidus]|uniref:Tetratricopeptide repeat protein n=1 Tax=Hymenobacter lucidus TaxID=2880930 RepID=A0ABS8ARY9_9BACT|nr:hypothetical protein [Hymenobacter lucidus]MCB2408378.1 hypothetical protein [Hymenobacter lucidus]